MIKKLLTPILIPIHAPVSLLVLALSLVSAGCSKSPEASDTISESAASSEASRQSNMSTEKASTLSKADQARLQMFDKQIHKHTKILSSDEFEGRAPATPGEEKTIAYLKSEFEALGLKHGNGDSYFQDVPVSQISTLPTVSMRLSGENYQRELKYRNEMMVTTLQQVPKTGIKDSELVFVGYGVVAPEYEWNDYEGVDVKGKTVVILVNDPGFATKDESLFNGKAMTYYGRWTYKYEEAARQGAAAALIVHQTDAAGYPWSVVSGSWSGPQTTLQAVNKNSDRCKVEGWLQRDIASEIFTAAGLNFDAQMKAAASRDFKAKALKLNATVELQNAIKTSNSKNVMALLPGTKRPDEVVIYTAHWDHLGKNPVMDGDNIYNGALDNATGTGALIALAKAFTEQQNKPERSILFLAVTAEESGLLGSKYYAQNPIYPLAKTVAVLNMDSMAIYGRMKDVVVIGFGSSELEEYLASAAKSQGRYLAREPTPEKGYFYRSDHFSMAKYGVPALYAKSGVEHVEHGSQWTKDKNNEYTANNYHKPSDEYDPNWDLSGAAEDTLLYFQVGNTLANESTFPNWYDGNEFRSIRDKSLAAAK